MVGMNRSGTKWVSNEISKYTNVYAVRSSRTGIREDNILGALMDKFDISIQEEYIGLIELWSSTDFFVRTCVDKSLFLDRSRRSGSHLDLFTTLMKACTEREGTEYWVQKFSPDQVVKFDLRDFLLVLVRRSITDQVKSNLLRRNRRPRLLDILRSVVSYCRQEKVMNSIASHNKVYWIQYESFLGSTVNVLELMQSFFKIDLGSFDSTITFIPNSSFHGRPREEFTKVQKAFIKISYRIVSVLPGFFIEWMRSRKRKGVLIPGSFSHIDIASE